MYSVGSKHSNYYGDEYIILEEHPKTLLIEWVDDFRHKEEINKTKFVKSLFRNPFSPSVKGFGYRGVGPHKSSLYGVATNVEICWRNLITRTCCEEHKAKVPSHKDNTICLDWLCFQTFGDWYVLNYKSGYELDKDLLIRGNKHYSPETCVMLPKEINSLISRGEANRGEHPPGVFRDKNGYYIAKSCGVFLGSFSSPYEAFLSYKNFKEKKAKDLAVYYKNNIDPRAYDALMGYMISIDD